MGSGFDDWLYWHFFKITINYNSSHIEILLNSLTDELRLLSDECSMKNVSEESLINLGLISTTLGFTRAAA
jgi:hypothetical protein